MYTTFDHGRKNILIEVHFIDNKYLTPKTVWMCFGDNWHSYSGDKGILRAPTPCQHIWLNTHMNLKLQSKLNGATTTRLHKYLLFKHGQT